MVASDEALSLLVPDGTAPGVDLDSAADAVRQLLTALGQDPASEGLRDTPRRVAASFAEMLRHRAFDLTTFANDEGYDELIVARDIPVVSLCEHHLLEDHHVGRARDGAGRRPDPKRVPLPRVTATPDMSRLGGGSTCPT